MVQVGKTIKGGMWDGFEVISVYSRAQALEDGELVDVSAVAAGQGFLLPVAMTRAVYWEMEQAARRVNAARPENLWPCDTSDLVAAALHGLWGIIRKMPGTDRVHARLNLGGSEVVILALLHGGDEGETVATIMEPGEQ